MSRSIAMAACFALAVPIYADDTKKSETGDPNVKYLTHCGNHCLLIGKVSDYAAKTSNQPDVKEIARKLSASHKEMLQGMAKVTSDLKLAVVFGTEKEVRDEIARLDKLKGYELDNEYIKKMIQEHELMLKHYKEQDANPNDKIKAFAHLTLPKIKDHIAELKALREKLPVK